MTKKFVVTIYAEDGMHHRNFTELQRAVNYISKQVGRPINLAEVQTCLDNSSAYSVIDVWGRVIEVSFMEVGSCKVCKKKNTPLCTITVNPEWQFSVPVENRVKETQKVSVCMDCANGFECGTWDIIYVGDKHKIVKNTCY